MKQFINKYLIIIILFVLVYGCSSKPKELDLLTGGTSKSWKTKVQFNIVLGDTIFVDQYEYQITTFNENGTWKIKDKLKTGEQTNRSGTWVIYPNENIFSFVHPLDTLTPNYEFVPDMTIIELTESKFILAVIDQNGDYEYYLELEEIKD